jgi:hypothetical protein
MSAVDRFLARLLTSRTRFSVSDQRFMPPTSKPVQDDRKQARRFIDAARKVGESGSLVDFEEALTQEEKKKGAAGRKKP